VISLSIHLYFNIHRTYYLFFTLHEIINKHVLAINVSYYKLIYISSPFPNQDLLEVNEFLFIHSKPQCLGTGKLRNEKKRNETKRKQNPTKSVFVSILVLLYRIRSSFFHLILLSYFIDFVSFRYILFSYFTDFVASFRWISLSYCLLFHVV
jgi:hypothetical protein